jgi:CheY-like chemotaxis protein
VLVVDDSAEIRPTLAMLLRLEGYLTMTAANGEEALARLNERLPCLILLDMDMPVMNGYQFRERQLRDPRFAEIPVLCLTGAVAFDAVTQGTGVRSLSKPVEWEDVLIEVQQICGPSMVDGRPK